MKVLNVRNVHEALPRAVQLLMSEGITRRSRNGDVMQYPTPVATVYEVPTERIGFWPERDYNVAFCLYESLWMLAGRHDVEPMLRYVKRFLDYSDDGRTLHGAYGYRWRVKFGMDQLAMIARRLQRDPNDRRSVLQIWDAAADLGADSKDIPCNLTATFQVSFPEGRSPQLDMVVFNRSNDIVWGAYFANAFHFSMLLEYMAVLSGYRVGTYTQVSVNWHGYLTTLQHIEATDNPYNDLHHVRMPANTTQLDAAIARLLRLADSGDQDYEYMTQVPIHHPWYKACHAVLLAHHQMSSGRPDRFDVALETLAAQDQTADLIASMTEWVMRRKLRR